MDQSSREGGVDRFRTTRWDIVLLSAQSQAPGCKEALAELCNLYWYPLYAFVRRRGHSPEDLSVAMRYLVKARVKPGREAALARAIHDKTLGQGSIAGDEYLWDMEMARVDVNHTVTWVEVCFCRKPLAEERPYWEEYFDLLGVKDAHARRNCRDLNGEEPWACCDCDCTKKLEASLARKGDPFLDWLKVMPDPIHSRPSGIAVAISKPQT